MIKALSLTQLLIPVITAATLVPMDDVAFNAEEGLERERSLEVRTTLTTEESILMFGDQEHIAGEGMVRKNQFSVKATDTYGRTIDGRPGRIVRRFETISDSMDMEGGESSAGMAHEEREDQASVLEAGV